MVMWYNVKMVKVAEVEEKIRQIVDKIVKEYQPDKILLFGSWAWGEPHQWSDVDLLVIKDSDKSPIERMREVKRIIFGMDLPTDILVYTPEQLSRRSFLGDPFIKKILTGGRLLYVKK